MVFQMFSKSFLAHVQVCQEVTIGSIIIVWLNIKKILRENQYSNIGMIVPGSIIDVIYRIKDVHKPQQLVRNHVEGHMI